MGDFEILQKETQKSGINVDNFPMILFQFVFKVDNTVLPIGKFDIYGIITL
jgi:hypothetical protein